MAEKTTIPPEEPATAIAPLHVPSNVQSRLVSATHSDPIGRASEGHGGRYDTTQLWRGGAQLPIDSMGYGLDSNNLSFSAEGLFSLGKLGGFPCGAKVVVQRHY